MLYKSVHTGSYDFGVAPVSLVDIHSRGLDRNWMQKRAVALTKELKSVRPELNKTALHLIAMGATEKYGCNRNFDGFRRGPLKKRHHTFVKEGHVFKNHRNKNPREASGEVKFSSYNDPMDRVELIVSVDNDKWGTELEKLASGEDIAFSMAARLPFDICSICGNKAPAREDYCSHMKKMAGQILSDGRMVYVDNPDPTFFDISGVFRPADRIAYSLQKVASAQPLTGADLAELDGLIPELPRSPIVKRSSHVWQKRKMLRKLADIEKEIEAFAPSDQSGLCELRGAFAPETKGVTDMELESLAPHVRDRVDKFMGALGQVRVSLPLRDFIRIIMGSETGGVSMSSVEKHLPGVFGRILEHGDEEVIEDGQYDPCGGLSDMPMAVQDMIKKMVPGMSLDEGPIHKRMIIVATRKIPKPEMLTTPTGIRSIKIASDDAGAELLAREYAKYKLSFLADTMEKEGSELLVRLGVLQNYVRI